MDKNGKLKADISLRDTENIPLKQDIQEYITKGIATRNGCLDR